MQTRILLDHEKTPDGTAHVVRALLRIDGTAPDPANRLPLNLSVVLDRSGSMGGAKLEHAKQAAALLVRRLWPEDVVSIVAYDDQVLTVVEPASGTEQHGVPERLAAILPGGSTNLSGGWLRGRELVVAGRRDGGVDRVLLLTDGLANVGITDPDQLVGLCRAALERGVTTTTLGFGEDYDETLLRRMAEAGGGSTYYIEDPDGAPAVFAEEIEGLLSLCAHDIRVAVRPAAAAQLTLVHHAYPSHEIEGGVRLELGDLYARDPRRLLAEFAVPVADPGEEVAIAEVGRHRAGGARERRRGAGRDPAADPRLAGGGATRRTRGPAGIAPAGSRPGAAGSPGGAGERRLRPRRRDAVRGFGAARELRSGRPGAGRGGGGPAGDGRAVPRAHRQRSRCQVSVRARLRGGDVPAGQRARELARRAAAGAATPAGPVRDPATDPGFTIPGRRTRVSEFRYCYHRRNHPALIMFGSPCFWSSIMSIYSRPDVAVRRRQRISAADPLKKAGIQMRQSVLEAVKVAVQEGAAASQNTFVECAVIRELRELRRKHVYEAYAEGAADPAFLDDMKSVAQALDGAAADGLRD